MSRLRWPRLGLRREILILLPVTLFLLVLVTGFTLFAYRSAIDLLTDDRQREVATLARQIAADLSSGPQPTPAELRNQVPTAQHIAILDSAGRTVRAFGDQRTGNPLGFLEQGPLTDAVAMGPGKDTGEMVIGLAPMQYQDQSHILRIDVPALALSRQRQAVHVLTWVVLPTSVALLVLAILFLPHFLKPYDTLVEQVQRVAPGTPDQDDVANLVSTVERALTALATAPEETPEDDIAALQRALGASLESGLLLLDKDGRVLTLNAMGAEMLDLEPIQEPIPVAECLRSHPALLQMLSGAVADSEGLPRQEIRIHTSAGSRTLGFTVHALRRDDGTVRGHLALFVDLTESQREAEALQITTSLEQLGELAAGIAHELRNSLATLRGYLTLIERHPEEESITDYLREIRRESDHLQRVLEDFLSFAQPDSARVEAVDLLELSRCAAADPAMAGFPVEIETTDPGPWSFQGDPQLLERVLRNLLHNAARAEREAGGAGPIRVNLRRSDDRVEVWIEDRGSGLPLEVRQRLFQPFVTSHSDGAGLGLSLAHRIVTLHQGKIRLEDRAEGGTRAVLSFPVGTFG